MSGGRRKTRRWAGAQARDPWVRRARAEGLPSRSAFKLEELLTRYRLVRTGQRVLELGASPGGWTRIVLAAVGRTGRVVAVDRLRMKAPAGAAVIEGDLTDAAVQAAALEALGGPADVVLSDLAPNLTGIRDVDVAQEAQLADLAAAIAARSLKRGGAFLVKTFEGPGSAALRRRLDAEYRRVRHLKPAASRARSSEFYLLAEGLRRHGVRSEGNDGGV